MKKIEKVISFFHLLLGFLSLVGLAIGYYFLENLRPKMIQFQPISAAEEKSAEVFGVALILLLGFCLISFCKIFRYLKDRQKISLTDWFLLLINTLCFFFIFADLALISDLGKQYRYQLSQPEWSILYPLITFQFVSALILTLAGWIRLKKEKGEEKIVKDGSLFLVAQYIGLICGLIGLVITMVNFAFPRPLWMIKIQTIMTISFLFLPYVFIVGYWTIVKVQEKTKECYDEKQIQDLGKSSFLSLILSLAIMGLLFGLNFDHPEELLSVLWFPFYLSLSLFLFSFLNLYFGRK